MLCKHLLLVVIGKMLEDHHGIVVDRPDVVRIALEDIHTRLVVLAPCSGIAQGVLLRESLREVEAESVHIVLRKQICETLLHMVLDHLVLVVDVVVDIEVMLSHGVEPWVVRSCRIA